MSILLKSLYANRCEDCNLMYQIVQLDRVTEFKQGLNLT